MWTIEIRFYLSLSPSFRPPYCALLRSLSSLNDQYFRDRDEGIQHNKGKEESIGIDTNNMLSSNIPCTCVLGTFHTKESHATYRMGLAKIPSNDSCKIIREGVKKKTVFIWDFVPNIGPHPPTAHVWDSTKWKIKVKFILLFRLFRAFYFFEKMRNFSDKIPSLGL